MNSIDSEKHGISPEEIEKRSLPGGKSKTLFNFHWIGKTRHVHERLNRYDKKKYNFKRKKLKENLNISKKVLVLAEGNQPPEYFLRNQYKIVRILTETKYFQSEKHRKLIKLIITGSKI